MADHPAGLRPHRGVRTVGSHRVGDVFKGQVPDDGHGGLSEQADVGSPLDGDGLDAQVGNAVSLAVEHPRKGGLLGLSGRLVDHAGHVEVGAQLHPGVQKGRIARVDLLGEVDQLDGMDQHKGVGLRARALGHLGDRDLGGILLPAGGQGQIARDGGGKVEGLILAGGVPAGKGEALPFGFPGLHGQPALPDGLNELSDPRPREGDGVGDRGLPPAGGQRQTKGRDHHGRKQQCQFAFHVMPPRPPARASGRSRRCKPPLRRSPGCRPGIFRSGGVLRRSDPVH